MTYSTLIIYTDGACEPVNPNGIASYGFVIYGKGDEIMDGVMALTEADKLLEGSGVVKVGENATNNLAEFAAPRKALKALNEKDIEVETIVIRTDSRLVSNIMSGTWTPNATSILVGKRKLTRKINLYEADIRFEWIPREKNEEADALSKSAVKEYLEENEVSIKGHPIRECPNCDGLLVVRDEKYGKFYGCSNYPDCEYTEQVEE